MPQPIIEIICMLAFIGLVYLGVVFYIYIHGKYGLPEEAEHYRPLFPDCEVIGFDYKAQTP